MKLALLGYGKMGKTIEALAKTRGHHIVHRFSSTDPVSMKMLQESDVAIEFSTPQQAPEHISACLKSGVPVVVGTTGWYDRYEELRSLADSMGISMFTATNFSLGVNMFFMLNEYLARFMQQHQEYRASIIETHHVHKKDAPSGTAITLAEGIMKQNPHYQRWNLTGQGAPGEDSLPITSLRMDEVPGTHEVLYQSAIDDISIRHVAHNRNGFALGALLAAEFIKDRRGVYGMKDLLQF